MALSEDQKALLRLLAKREDGYEDIAALKGRSVEEVRAEVKAALAELEASSAPAPAPPEVREEPAPPPSEARPKAKPSEPKDEAFATATPPSPASPSAQAAKRARPAVPAERRRLLLFTGGALAIVAVVLIAIAVFGGDSDSGESGPREVATEATAAESAKITQAVLEPVDGGSGSGSALFGRLGQNVVLQVTAEGLEATAPGESYTVWLYRSPKLSLRAGSTTVDESGRLGARFPVPTELLAYIASGAFDQIYVSRTEDAAYKREVAQAKADNGLPPYSGETVLSGEITGPVVKAASGAGG